MAADYNYFFIRGHMRSGTNWLGAMLNLHPRVLCRGEFHFEILHNALGQFSQYDWCLAAADEAVKSAAERALENLICNCLDALAGSNSDVRWLGDRTPYLLYPLSLPDAPYIFLVRDGRDVLVSWTYHQLRIGAPEPVASVELLELKGKFNRNPDYFKQRPQDLLTSENWVRHVARMWCSYNRSYDQLVDEIDSGLTPARVHRCFYENLHKDPETERSLAYRFLDLDPSEAAPLSEETHTLPGFSEENPLSIRRKGAIGDWKAYFTEEAKEWFKEEAGGDLIALGYESDLNW